MTYNTTSFPEGEIIRVITASGNVTATSSDQVIIINKTVPATTTVTLPSSPVIGKMIVITDGGGNSGIYNITVVPASGTIDGSSSIILASNYTSVSLIYNGSSWSVIP